MGNLHTTFKQLLDKCKQVLMSYLRCSYSKAPVCFYLRSMFDESGNRIKMNFLEGDTLEYERLTECFFARLHNELKFNEGIYKEEIRRRTDMYRRATGEDLGPLEKGHESKEYLLLRKEKIVNTHDRPYPLAGLVAEVLREPGMPLEKTQYTEWGESEFSFVRNVFSSFEKSGCGLITRPVLYNLLDYFFNDVTNLTQSLNLEGVGHDGLYSFPEVVHLLYWFKTNFNSIKYQKSFEGDFTYRKRVKVMADMYSLLSNLKTDEVIEFGLF